MTVLIGFLTVLLVLDCVFLILLILIQLPKKEAGAGIAFGGAAADTLFGAGSGNVLTKVTKYAAGFFVAFALVLSIINAHHARESSASFGEALQEKASEAGAVIPLATNAPILPLQTPMLDLTSTNVGAAAATGATSTNAAASPTAAEIETSVPAVLDVEPPGPAATNPPATPPTP